MFSQPGTASGGSLFASNSNNNTSSLGNNSLFGGTSNQGTNSFGSSNTQSKPLFGSTSSNSSSFGTNGTGNTSFGTQNSAGGSLFGGSNQQSNSLFGGNANNTPPLFGMNKTQPSSTFSLNPTNNNPSQGDLENQSLFRMSSAFSYSSDKNVIHGLAEKNLRESAVASYNSTVPSSTSPSSVQSNTQYPQQSSQMQTNLYSNNSLYSSTRNNSTSSLNLGVSTSPYRKPPTVPGWAKEKRYVPVQTSGLRHVSSFTKNDRVPSTPSHRKSSISPSQSPSNSFGNSFSGILKPSHIKKKTFIQEDPPPTKSIYDLDTSNIAHFKNDTSIAPDPARLSSFSSGSGPTGSSNTSATSLPSPNQVIDSVSVIIFGFPASLTPAVVTYFSRFGNILENVDSARKLQSTLKGGNSSQHPIHTGKNWLKITYDNSVSASRAIQENGSMFAGQYIIGCVPVTSDRLKDFEKACEASMYESESAKDSTSLFSDFSFTEEPSRENQVPGSSDSSEVPNGSKQSQPLMKSVFGHKSSSKTSVPVIAGSKRATIHDGRHIFNTPAKQMRYSSSLFKTPNETDSSKQLPGSKHTESSKLQSRNPSWISWTSKKAQELVFGWDDL